MDREGCVGIRGPLLVESAIITLAISFKCTNAFELIVVRHFVCTQASHLPGTLIFEPIAL